MRTFDITAPADDDKEGLGAEELRDAKNDFKERMELDHQFGSSTTSSNPLCDGYHKQVTMKALGADLGLLADAGRLYTKVGSSTKVELFYINDSGEIVQITNGYSLAIRLSFNSAILYGGATSAATSPNPIVFTPKIFDVLSEQSAVNGKFTPQRSGTYLIIVTTTNAATLTLKVSGSTISSATSVDGGQIVFNQPLTAGQYVEIYSDVDVGVASTINIARIV